MLPDSIIGCPGGEITVFHAHLLTDSYFRAVIPHPDSAPGAQAVARHRAQTTFGELCGRSTEGVVDRQELVRALALPLIGRQSTIKEVRFSVIIEKKYNVKTRRGSN